MNHKQNKIKFIKKKKEKQISTPLTILTQTVHFQILIRRSTLHLASAVETTVGDFPAGTVAFRPLQVTLIPTFFVFIPPIFTFTFVSSWIFSGKLFLFFKFNELPSTLWLVLVSTDFRVVVFLVPWVKAGIEPEPTLTPLEVIKTVIGL